MRVIGWTPDETEALPQWERLEEVFHRLQKDEAIRIRSAGAGRVGILDLNGQWIPQDAPTREWPVALAALQAEGWTVNEAGELVAFAAPAAEESVPKVRGRGRAAATEG